MDSFGEGGGERIGVDKIVNSEKGGGFSISPELVGKIDNQLEAMKVEVAKALRPVATVAFGALVAVSEKAGEFGDTMDRLVHSKTGRALELLSILGLVFYSIKGLGNIDQNITRPGQVDLVGSGLVKDELRSRDTNALKRLPRLRSAAAIEKKTDEEHYQERLAIVKARAKSLAENPGLWNEVKASCRASMVRIELTYVNSETGKGMADPGSGTIISEQRVLDQNGNPAWIYQVLTADHVARGDNDKANPGEIIIYPGSQTEGGYRFIVLDYTQVIDSNGLPQDQGIVTVVGFQDRARITASGFSPLGVDKMVGADITDRSEKYMVLQYPDGAGNFPQFTIATFTELRKSAKHADTVIMLQPLKNTGTTAKQSSGGGVCNARGEVVGTVQGHPGDSSDVFIVDDNPANIKYQISVSLARGKTVLGGMGFKIVQ